MTRFVICVVLLIAFIDVPSGVGMAGLLRGAPPPRTHPTSQTHSLTVKQAWEAFSWGGTEPMEQRGDNGGAFKRGCCG